MLIVSARHGPQNVVSQSSLTSQLQTRTRHRASILQWTPFGLLIFAMPNTKPDPPRNAKRKEPPSSHDRHAKKPRFDARTRQQDARQLHTQTSNEAFSHGALDVDKFIKSREYEIRAMQDGMQRSKRALNRRAFQQVPKELRRRTASHNVKRVPRRLRRKAKQEASP